VPVPLSSKESRVRIAPLGDQVGFIIWFVEFRDAPTSSILENFLAATSIM
jgi:hypothetical protein